MKKTNKMELKCVGIDNEDYLNDHYTCDSSGDTPPFEINNIPKDTKSLVLFMDDLDGEDLGITNHWVVWNIPPTILKIEENNIPQEAIEGINDKESNGYSPPCPHVGVHRYRIQIYALDKKLNLTPKSGKKDVEENMVGSIISIAEIIVKYKREDITEDETMLPK